MESRRFTYRRVVAEDDIDDFGHANNLRVLAWTLEAAQAHSDDVGWPLQRYLAESCAFIVRDHQIRYQRPAFAGDVILIETWVGDLRRSASRRHYIMRRESDQTRIATASTDWVFVGLPAGRPIAVPDTVIEAFGVVRLPDDDAA